MIFCRTTTQELILCGSAQLLTNTTVHEHNCWPTQLFINTTITKTTVVTNDNDVVISNKSKHNSCSNHKPLTGLQYDNNQTAIPKLLLVIIYFSSITIITSLTFWRFLHDFSWPQASKPYDSPKLFYERLLFPYESW